MTIKELYEWAIKNRVENYDIMIQYRDGGGFYCGSSILHESDIEINHQYFEVIM